MAGKVITSPVPEFPGTITLIERITLPVLGQYQDIVVANKFRPSVVGNGISLFDAYMLICERWDISGQVERPTVETFVMPEGNEYDATTEFMRWLKLEIENYIGKKTNVPKF